MVEGVWISDLHRSTPLASLVGVHLEGRWEPLPSATADSALASFRVREDTEGQVP